MQGLNTELSVPGVLKMLRRAENEMARDLRSGSSSLGGERWGRFLGQNLESCLPSGRIRRFEQGCDLVWQCHASS